jgi:LuxR family quorum sensing-dependent transcriptional regulator
LNFDSIPGILESGWVRSFGVRERALVPGIMPVQFLDEISKARDPASCAQCFERAVAGHGISVFACGETDPTARHPDVFFALHGPEVWRKFYLENQRIRSVALVNGYRGSAVTWGELAADRESSCQDRALFRLCAELGWTEGLAVSIQRGASRFGLVSLAGTRPPLGAEEKAHLTLMSVYFHERMRGLATTHGFPAPPAGLSSRELQCLRLVAHGKSDRQIGAAIGIAATTAHGYVESAKFKLGAATRAESIALAVAYGIVAPEDKMADGN